MSAGRRTQAQLLLVAEVSLAAMSVASVLSVRRIFRDGSFLPVTITAVLLAHLLAALLRRGRRSQVTTVLVSAVAAVLFVTWTRLRSTTPFAVVPTGETLSVAREQARVALHTLGKVTPPAPVLPGFVLVACLGTWLMAVTADLAAFRARAQLEAIIPAMTLFVFGGALGRGGNRLTVAAAFVAATLVHWLAQRSLAATASPTWLAGERGGSVRPLLRVGAGLIVVAVLAAVLVGPNLPGADAKAVVPWRASDRTAPKSRVTVSPLVDIKTEIVNQSNVIAFHVRSSRRAYWRLTSLEEFNGQQWTSNGEYERAKGQLGSDVDTASERTTRMTATFRIDDLAQFWLPAPFRPVHIDGTDARYDSDSNSLVTEQQTARDLRYTVTAAVPVITRTDLQGVAPIAPRSVAEVYTRLPTDFSRRVQELAGTVVRGATTQYDKAIALQNFFHTPAFAYDLSVPAGHSENALEQFLFITRRGYCEQFAGAYAAMARAVGLPARVAVGFTPGELDASTKQYVVRGLNAHAWPEVYLDRFGWVAFEPTPGRGMPGAQSYTGLPEAQANPDDPSAATTVPGSAPAPGATTTSTLAAGTPTTAAAPTPTTRPGASTPTHGRRTFPVLLGVLVALPFLWAGALATARVVRRRRRRRAARTPGARVLVSWREATEALARAGTPPWPWETPSEYATRAAGATGVDRRRLVGLAGLATRVVYGSPDIAEELAVQAAGVADSVAVETDRRLGRRTRLRLLVDPRPLLPERRAHVVLDHR